MSSITNADTAWTIISGQATWEVSGLSLENAGIGASTGAQAIDGPLEQHLHLELSPDSSMTFVSSDAVFSHISGGDLDAVGSMTLTTESRTFEISKIRLRIQYDADKAPTFVVSGVIENAEIDLFRHEFFKPGFNQEAGAFYLEASDAIVTEDFAVAIDRTDLIGKAFGSFNFAANLVWSGGDEPQSPEILPVGGAPRAPTVCSKPIGQDLIVGELYGPLQNPPSQQIGGVWYDTFSVGTTSCNLGDEILTWEGSSGFVHPAIGQNVFRLKAGRFEQIGQSWLKHGFTVAAGSACCSCTGPGGPTLYPGCSDPYGGGLNNSQGSIKPKWRVNPTTGAHVHGSNPSFSGDVARRLMVRHSDIDPALNPSSIYFIEGQYVHEEDAGLGNDNNNASYRQLSISASGANEYTASVTATTQREECGIRAWQDTDPGVAETDAEVPNDGLYIVAAKATDLGGGIWHYEYAVQNLNGNRGIKSFSIPISPAANVTNIGFHDVDYHDGDGDNSVDRDGTDWPGVFANGTVSWEMVDVGSNSNALLWGTLYNFRFDADVEPSTESGEATMNHFRALAGNPDSFTAFTVVPQPYAVAMEVVGAAPDLLATCQSTDIVLKIQDGAETFDTSSPRLWHSYDGGSFASSVLTPMGDDLYMATLPAPSCGDSARYYFTALSMSGTPVSLPVEATTTNTYFLANVGFEEINTYLETDFESGLPGGWTADGLWNVGASCSGVPNGNCSGSDGSSVAYFGQPGTCNYDTGLHEDASITTPAIALPALSEQILLTYCSALERHSLPGGDWPEVRVTPEGQATDVVDQPAVGAFVGGAAVWQERVVDLTAYAGQTVTIAFNFDNLIPFDDAYLGWMIDNVSVRALEIDCIPGCSSPDGDMNTDGQANGADLQSFTAAVMGGSTNAVDLEHGDFSGNGVIDMADIDLMVSTILGN
ncbi:MAG TPA: hypothetical protein P5081_22770 [Phycisphaerae bacterium]|nr:hypothetical protein [Phycisphaerae bacterium]HRW55707.1 hypothetical protein [Phycisphaerae bacterium]